MLFSDEYLVVAKSAETSLRERGSRFLAYTYPVETEMEVKALLEQLKAKYPDATHHCYAYVIGAGSEAQRANDDGEPANSAGKPILRAILSAQLTNVLVVVVRYFGGTLLGIPGLINAYGLAAKQVLEVAGAMQRVREVSFRVSVDFANEQELHRLVSKFNGKIEALDYNNQGLIAKISIKNSLSTGFESAVFQHYQLDFMK
jgi:uncharacterized YigZ family protein